jgi:hypothetical protein
MHVIALVLQKDIISAAGKRKEIKSDHEVKAVRDTYKAARHFQEVGAEGMLTMLEWTLQNSEAAKSNQTYLSTLASNADKVAAQFAVTSVAKLVKPTTTLMNKLVASTVADHEFTECFNLQEVKSAHNALKAVYEQTRERVESVAKTLLEIQPAWTKASGQLLQSRYQVNKNGVLFLLGKRGTMHPQQGRQKRSKLKAIWDNVLQSADVLALFSPELRVQIDECLKLGVAGKHEAAVEAESSEEDGPATKHRRRRVKDHRPAPAPITVVDNDRRPSDDDKFSCDQACDNGQPPTTNG